MLLLYLWLCLISATFLFCFCSLTKKLVCSATLFVRYSTLLFSFTLSIFPSSYGWPCPFYAGALRHLLIGLFFLVFLPGVLLGTMEMLRLFWQVIRTRALVFFFALVLILFANSLFNYHRVGGFCLQIHCLFSSDLPWLGTKPVCGGPFYIPAYVHQQLVTGQELPLAHRFWYVILDLPYLPDREQGHHFLVWARVADARGHACGGILVGASRMDVASIHFLLEQLLGDDSEDDSDSATRYG